jgi:hypothetical protein
MDDDAWLAIVGARNWVVLSHDQKWHAELVNREAIKQHGVGCFYLWGGQATTWEKLRCFMRAYPKMESLAGTTAKPYIFKVEGTGKIKSVPIP